MSRRRVPIATATAKATTSTIGCTVCAAATGALEVDATSEVVVGDNGCYGRIGALFLKQSGAIAVPRGVAPGCLTTAIRCSGNDTVDGNANDDNDNDNSNAPFIIVDIPSTSVSLSSPLSSSMQQQQQQQQQQEETSWKAIHDMTPKPRQSDLVWIIHNNKNNNKNNTTIGTNNGRLSSWQRDATVVLSTATTATANSSNWYVFGKHATAVAAVLTKEQEFDSNVQLVESWTDLLGVLVAAAVAETKAEAEVPDGRDGPTNITNTNTIASSNNNNRILVPIPALDLVCYGGACKAASASASAPNNVKSAIVVGGGIMGSSIARALVQRGIPKVTVYDPTPTGTTTNASWAWLNANQKPPPSYQSLNQMGLRGWRSDPLVSSLPSWTGTLVRTQTKLELKGGYTAEGPLSPHRIRALEPEANFTDTTGFVYYFADEGHVDPQEAVLALRTEAMANGVSFVSDERVVGLVRSNNNNKDDNNNNRVVGVKTSSSIEQLADVVIVAAGASSSDEALGGVPLVHNPSRSYFASPISTTTTTTSTSSSTAPPPPPPPRLNRICMDQVRGLYLAQRKDGTLVAGGGALPKSDTTTKLSPEELQKQLTLAHAIAQQLAPNPIGTATVTHKEEVISKPMPQDGFPILGYLEPGLYSAVTHSGMTMAPLLGQLVAAEVTEQVSLSILDDYRPERFEKDPIQIDAT